jgi:hypothetical protein
MPPAGCPAVHVVSWACRLQVDGSWHLCSGQYSRDTQRQLLPATACLCPWVVPISKWTMTRLLAALYCTALYFTASLFDTPAAGSTHLAISPACGMGLWWGRHLSWLLLHSVRFWHLSVLAQHLVLPRQLCTYSSPPIIDKGPRGPRHCRKMLRLLLCYLTSSSDSPAQSATPLCAAEATIVSGHQLPHCKRFASTSGTLHHLGLMTVLRGQLLL